MNTQNLLIDQDKEIDKLADAVKSLKDIADDINTELKIHEEIIIDIENKTDHANVSLLTANKKVRTLASTMKNNKCNICFYLSIVVLVGLLIFVIVKSI